MTIQDKTLHPGELLFSEGENDFHIYIIKLGKIELMSRNPYYILDGNIKVAGDLLGVMTALCGLPCQFSARAVEHSIVTQCDVKDFTSLIRDKPTIALKIVSGLSKIVRTLNHKIMEHLDETNDKQDDDKLFDIGLYFLEKKEYDKAEYVFRKCDEIYGSNKGISEKSLFKLGEIYELTNDKDKAIKTYQELIDRFPLDKRITRVASSILKRLKPPEPEDDTGTKQKKKGLLSLIKSSAKEPEE